MKNFNIIYFGSPYYSCNVLQSILDSKFNVTSVVSQKTTYRRRNKKKDTAITSFANDNKLRVFTPECLSDQNFLKDIENQNPDFFILFSYGKILKNELLKIPKYASINIHCSLLPHWRGGAPIQRALLNGDETTGVTFFAINDSLDRGKIIKSFEYRIKSSDNAITLQDKLSSIAAENIEEIISSYSEFNLFTQNEERATYAKKIQKEEAVINWESSSQTIIRQVKAFVEWPKAHAIITNCELKILDASISDLNSSLSCGDVVKFSRDNLCIKTGDGVIDIIKLQLPGKTPINIRDLFNSNSPLSNNLKEISKK